MMEQNLLEKWGHVGAGGADAPLTLEQIQQRRGKPIWVVPVKRDADWAAHWNILGDAVNPSMLCRRVESISNMGAIIYYFYEIGYGDTWVAYDWPPDWRTK